MATDLKFDQFQPGGEMQFGDKPVGLRSSDLTKNYIFDFPGTGIKDASGNYFFRYGTVGVSAVNYPRLVNSLTNTAVLYTAEGIDGDIDVSVQPKNNGQLILDELIWPASDGIADSVIKTDGFGNLSFTSGATVDDIIGTANQVLANGTFGIPQSGAVTLTTPQDIAPTSTPTFSSLTLTNPLTLANGGSSKALTANAGGIVWTDANSMEILAGTSTALQMLQSGSLATPTWSTATWPVTTTINQILYSSAANTVTGLPTSNGAMIRTSSTGVPSWSASLTDGQVMIGATGGSPSAASITAGTGITLTPGANSLTIASSGGGLSWTDVTGISQAMAIDSGYTANNAGLVTLTLPVTAVYGTAISVLGKGAGGWLIAQNAAQSIQFGSSTTTIGAGGSLASTNAGDSINLICTTANTVWTVQGAPQGIITVV